MKRNNAKYNKNDLKLGETTATKVLEACVTFCFPSQLSSSRYFEALNLLHRKPCHFPAPFSQIRTGNPWLYLVLSSEFIISLPYPPMPLY